MNRLRTVDDLKNAITYEIYNTTESELNNVFNDLKRRLVNQGRHFQICNK